LNNYDTTAHNIVSKNFNFVKWHANFGYIWQERVARVDRSGFWTPDKSQDARN